MHTVYIMYIYIYMREGVYRDNREKLYVCICIHTREFVEHHPFAKVCIQKQWLVLQASFGSRETCVKS